MHLRHQMLLLLGSDFKGLLTCWGMLASWCQRKNSKMQPCIQVQPEALGDRKGSVRRF